MVLATSQPRTNTRTIQVHSHILVAVVAGPVRGLLVALAQPHQDLEVFELENLGSSRLHMDISRWPQSGTALYLTSSTFSGSPLTKSFSSGVPSVGINDTLVFSGAISGTSLMGCPGSEMSEYPVAHRIRPLPTVSKTTTTLSSANSRAQRTSLRPCHTVPS